MQSEIRIIEMTLMPMPLPKEKEEAYWAAMREVAEMILNAERSLDGGTALGGSGEQDGDAHGSDGSTELVV